jgi:hypothetical protein
VVNRAEPALRAGDRLYFVGSRPFSARYYSRDTAGLVDGPQALAAVLPAAGQRVFLAVRKREATTLLATWRGQVTPLYSSRRYTLLQVAGEGATAP